MSAEESEGLSIYTLSLAKVVELLSQKTSPNQNQGLLQSLVLLKQYPNVY